MIQRNCIGIKSAKKCDTTQIHPITGDYDIYQYINNMIAQKSTSNVISNKKSDRTHPWAVGIKKKKMTKYNNQQR